MAAPLLASLTPPATTRWPLPRQRRDIRICRCRHEGGALPSAVALLFGALGWYGVTVHVRVRFQLLWRPRAVARGPWDGPDIPSGEALWV